MALPKKRELDTFGDVVNLIQRVRPTPLSIFRGDEDEPGQQYRDCHDVEVLNLIFDPDKMIWRKLHNDPNVEIISEQEKSNKLSTLTYVKFVRRVPVDEPDPEPEVFQEPCEEDDALADEMWGG